MPRSISDTIRYGQELAKSIGHVHVFGFVHKNVRPETILLLRNFDADKPSTFLVGFERFRKDGGMTSRAGNEIWQENIYRHPGRHGQNPADAYMMQHDIYSLGVCLLEIGLWESFVKYDDNRDHPVPSALLNLSSQNPRIEELMALKDHLLFLARTQLPQRTGSKYSEVVQTCLTCVDEHNEDFGDESEFLDEDGVLFGVRYIEKRRHSSIFVLCRRN